ncbi:hypothetical protein SISSUDRAFT_729039 [Sistotremastrum suecicum HHB10207 ss-3]|uniref:DUF6533 domain-containing protein n=1 Tax=Sistotremastrum suecicum HHB10207 ss-3 TaxID=1314776 RepID=A0A166DHF9_9AGAM|nr:hypothetical protein SISSUDRAFT_729039 [Sistotremastrum suecicum HHB10207 ss-3]
MLEVVDRFNLGLIERDQYAVYGWISALTWLLWSLLISFDDEITYVWKSKWTRCHLLYVYERYVVLLMTLSMGPVWNGWKIGSPPSDLWCHIIGIYQSGIALAAILGTDIILILRVRALYFSRKITIFLIVAFVVQFVGGAVTAILGLAQGRQFGRVLVIPERGEYTCVSSEISGFRIGNWIPSIAFETLLFFLTLYQSIQQGFHKRKDSVWRVPILIDGITVYILLFVTSAMCEVAWSRGMQELIAVFYPWNIAVISFSGSRLILNMRKTATPNGAGRDAPLTTVGDIEFYQMTTADELTCVDEMSVAPERTPVRAEQDVIDV